MRRTALLHGAAWLAILTGSSIAQETPEGTGTLGAGLTIGAVLVALFAALISVSVVAKLLIVFGVVPRRPENAFHALVHAAANFVGALTRPKPRLRDDGRRERD